MKLLLQANYCLCPCEVLLQFQLSLSLLMDLLHAQLCMLYPFQPCEPWLLKAFSLFPLDLTWAFSCSIVLFDLTCTHTRRIYYLLREIDMECVQIILPTFMHAWWKGVTFRYFHAEVSPHPLALLEFIQWTSWLYFYFLLLTFQFTLTPAVWLCIFISYTFCS